MSGPPPATAATRLAVRRSLAGVAGPVSAAVSGGADSLALAAALAFELPSSAAVVVDHGLQPGSGDVAAKAAAQCESLGLRATVLTGRSAPGEAAARELRYQLLDAVEGTILLGHTRDDQAETVLLGALRGSGARALAGMAPVRGRYRRPFLDLSREQTRAACLEAGLAPWEDPHNDDLGFSRVRFRQLLAELPTAGLARTARLLREDADALDALAVPLSDVPALLALPAALRSRSLKRWAEQECGRAVTSAHVEALRALVEDWRGQGPVALPGGGRVSRVGGRLAFTL
ncbi:MAG: tRNA(Ile)-lysidine synthetase [Frankiales bacterium]|nr:tRNA(Ile)-lysidine synthetase [Frankiales bacterium]